MGITRGGTETDLRSPGQRRQQLQKEQNQPELCPKPRRKDILDAVLAVNRVLAETTVSDMAGIVGCISLIPSLSPEWMEKPRLPLSQSLLIR